MEALKASLAKGTKPGAPERMPAKRAAGPAAASKRKVSQKP